MLEDSRKISLTSRISCFVFVLSSKHERVLQEWQFINLYYVHSTSTQLLYLSKCPLLNCLCNVHQMCFTACRLTHIRWTLAVRGPGSPRLPASPRQRPRPHRPAAQERSTVSENRWASVSSTSNSRHTPASNHQNVILISLIAGPMKNY